jgi:hypothetical protein
MPYTVMLGFFTTVTFTPADVIWVVPLPRTSRQPASFIGGSTVQPVGLKATMFVNGGCLGCGGVFGAVAGNSLALGDTKKSSDALLANPLNGLADLLGGWELP